MAADNSPHPETTENGVEVTIIGCGSPHPAPTRFGSAVAIRYGGHAILVDCGPGTTYKMLQYGLQPKEFSALLITHHHFDHNSDVPTFGLTRWESVISAQDPLLVTGPPGTKMFIDKLFGENGAFRPDIVARREAPLSQAKVRMLGGSLPRPDLLTAVTELAPGDGIQLPSGWKVSTALAEHVEPFHTSIAYRIEIGDVSICVTGDTERNQPITDLAKGADLLIAMCGDEEQNMRKRGLTAGQMGTESCGTLARDAGVGAIVLTHTNTRVEKSPNRERATHQVAQIFDGDTYFSEEGLRIYLSANRT